MKRIAFTILAILTLSAGTVAMPLAAGAANADTAQAEVCAGAGAVSTSGTCDNGTGPSINSVIATVVNVMSALVGAISVIMIVYGGFRYVTSGGDSGKIGSAKNTIIFALVGVVIVLLAQALVQFVIDKV